MNTFDGERDMDGKALGKREVDGLVVGFRENKRNKRRLKLANDQIFVTLSKLGTWNVYLICWACL